MCRSAPEQSDGVDHLLVVRAADDRLHSDVRAPDMGEAQPDITGLTSPASCRPPSHAIPVARCSPRARRIHRVVPPRCHRRPRIQRVFAGRAQASGQPAEEVAQEALAIQSVKRLVDPADIAAPAVFLASDRARSISGRAIPLHGGSQISAL